MLPERYTVSLNVPGYDVSNVDGHNAVLDMTSVTGSKTTTTIKDSIMNVRDSTFTTFTSKEQLACHNSKAYTVRVQPKLTVEQLSADGDALAFFGDSVISNAVLVGQNDTISAWTAADGYYFKRPVVSQGKEYTWRLRMSEDYVHTEDSIADHVACESISFLIDNKTAGNSSTTLTGDSIEGKATYTFSAVEPDLAVGMQAVTIRATYGASDSKTSVAWRAPFADASGGQTMYNIGGVQTGDNFVTAGPNKLLFVLRDPPGSKSYSYLREGTTFTENSTYTGTETVNIGSKLDVEGGVSSNFIISLAALQKSSTSAVVSGDASVEETYTGSKNFKRTWTTNRAFTTSTSPRYVGADGDLFVGYSTNLVFGRCNQLMLVRGDTYRSNPALFDKAYTDTDADYVLASRAITTLGEQIETTFDYAQRDIETVVIPNIETLRDDLFEPWDNGDYQATMDRINAEVTQQADKSLVYYVSRVAKTDPLYAQPGQYDVIYSDGYWKEHQSVGDNYICPDRVLQYNQWIESWKKYLAENEQAKSLAQDVKENYSVAAGSGAIDYSETYESSRGFSSGFQLKIASKQSGGQNIEFETGVLHKFNFLAYVNSETAHGNTWDSEATRTHTYGFVLEDDDVSDYLSVDVLRAPTWNEKTDLYEYATQGGTVSLDDIKALDGYSTFIFRKVGGATTAPYEDAETVKYWEGHIGEKLDNSTAHVDVPSLLVPNAVIEGVPMGDVAYLDIVMTNMSESKVARPYMLWTDDITNPDGLEIYVDGVSLRTSPSFWIEYGEEMRRTLALHRTGVLNYDDIVLQLTTVHDDPDIALQNKSQASFSVHFVPSSSPVSISQPSGEWNYNTSLSDTTLNGKSVHYLPVVVDSYDVNYPYFHHMELQTKRHSEGDDAWIAHATWTKEQLQELDGTVRHMLVMDDYADADYDLRAVCFSEVNNVFYERSSDIRSGVKDMVRPQAYGDPGPSNGILTSGQNIELTFNEAIDQGLVNKEYISVRGSLNGEVDTDRSTYVSLDGVNSELITELEFNMSGKPVTVEMTVRPQDLRTAPIFAHGGTDHGMEISILEDRRLQARIGSNIITAATPCAEADYQVGTWTNIAMSYNVEAQLLNVFCNGTAVIADVPVPSYAVTGPFIVGHSRISESSYFHGDVASIRIWQKAMGGAEIMESSQRQLSGREQGLLACYDLNEGQGTVASDKTHGLNLLMRGNAQWTLPDGRALSFAAPQQSYAQLDASQSVVTAANDWTLQLWFMSEAGQTNATILSSGEYEDASLNGNRFGLGFNAAGELQYVSGGYSVSLGTGLNDGVWHCLGITLSRTTGFARFYVDGNFSTYALADQLGGISTDHLTVGAKRTLRTVDFPIFSQFFTGAVDDIQLWRLARTSKQMTSDYNSALEGNEVGLVGYWPFDYDHVWQQGTEIDSTTMNLATATQLPGALYGGATFTASCAPVKRADAMADLPFDFMTTERSIVILPTSSASALTGNTLTVSVSDISDLHGNVMASPVSWTVLMKQTKAEWMSDDLDVTIRPDEAYTGNFYIFNTTGTDYPYTISNIPSWMTIEEAEGTLTADNLASIPFTIKEGMAIGNYNEVIYLDIEGQSPSPLYLRVKVRGDEPAWTTSSATAAYHASVFGQMRFDGYYSEDTADMIGAFLGSKCIGVAHTSYDSDLKMHYALLSMGWDDADKAALSQLSFRMFDASTGLVYVATPSQAVTCRNDSVFGTPTSPVVFDVSTSILRSYQLSAGWNWISLPLSAADGTDAFDRLALSLQGSEIIKSAEATCRVDTTTMLWEEGSRFSITPYEMYMIRVPEATTMLFSGEPVVDQRQPITISPRWNWIGYTPLSNLSLTEALAGYEAAEGDIVKDATRFAVYSRGFWVGSLKYMQPGTGYMLYSRATAGKTLVYPSSSAVASTDQRANAPLRTNSSVEPHTMTVIASAAEVADGDSLLLIAADGTALASSPVQTGDSTLHFFALSEPTDVPLRFAMKRGENVLPASTTLTYRANQQAGTLEQPVRVSFALSATLRAYPSPAEATLHVAFSEPQATSVVLSVYDMTGLRVLQQALGAVSAGAHEVDLDVSRLTPGVYAVRKESGSGAEGTRFIKK